jgi:electron-transferring-flavoprotein dehydrogenase
MKKCINLFHRLASRKLEITKNLNHSRPLYINNNFSSKFFSTSDNTNNNEEKIEREEMETDVLIVGGGPAGLAAAIKLKQLAKAQNKEIDVTLIEKGSEIGAHILSGNCFQAKCLEELIPDWKEKGAPVETQVSKDKFLLLFKNLSISIPEFLLPKAVHNKGNYIISLSELCRWLGKEAEELGVNVFTGFAGKELFYNQEKVAGVITNDFGISKSGKKKPSFQAGNILKAKYTVLAEGCRGSLSERVIQKYNLREKPQSYGIGLKEVWEVDLEKNKEFIPGLVQHSVGWPLDYKTYGGSFVYHMKPNLIHVGFVVGLDYENPYINPYEEFQRFKTHKDIAKYFKDARCIAYGSRCLNEGGYYSIPRLDFPGGVLVGDAAGFLNVMKIKGTHNAISSGMIAAETIYSNLSNNKEGELSEYSDKVKKSAINTELFQTRNFHGGFSKGLFFGLIHGYFINLIKGREFWTFSNKKKDSQMTEKSKKFKKIEYPKHDGILTFDLLENLARSGTNHDHDQPSHLRIKKGKESSPLKSYVEYAAPEERFCPAKVYEFVKDENNNPKLQINAQNCLHCKCCSIKMVDEYIDWNVPQGGEGPKYTLM